MEDPRKMMASCTRIHQLIQPWASRYPDHIALQDAYGSLSYQALLQGIEEAGRRLEALGVRPGDRVLLVGENCVALGVMVFAISALDAWAVVVNSRLSPREIDTFKEHSGARRVFYTPEVSAEAAEHAARHGAPTETWPGIGTLAVGGLNDTAVPEPVSASPVEQVAVMIYTSGTSGSPKAVMLTHANLLHISEVVRQLRGLGPLDRIYGVLPMAHVVGLSSQLVGSLACGSTVLLEPRYSPEGLAQAMLHDGLTVIVGVPAMFAKLLEWASKTGTELTSHTLRIVGVAGSPLTPELKEKAQSALGIVVHNNYGLTEMSPTVSQTPLDKPRTDCSVGMPVPGVEVRIADADGQVVAPGTVGELQVRGPNLMKGYYRAPELTRAAIDPQGWFHTGDLARQDPDGALFIMGRSKELIIRSGFNVYPVEVEQVLSSHPDIVQAAVVGRQVAGNEEVVAFVETVGNATLDCASLEQYLRERLSPYKIPTEIRFMAQLPAAPTGKILKNVLKEMAAADAGAVAR